MNTQDVMKWYSIACHRKSKFSSCETSLSIWCRDILPRLEPSNEPVGFERPDMNFFQRKSLLAASAHSLLTNMADTKSSGPKFPKIFCKMSSLRLWITSVSVRLSSAISFLSWRVIKTCFCLYDRRNSSRFAFGKSRLQEEARPVNAFWCRCVLQHKQPFHSTVKENKKVKYCCSATQSSLLFYTDLHFAYILPL